MTEDKEVAIAKSAAEDPVSNPEQSLTAVWDRIKKPGNLLWYTYRGD
jgi:hypothetical protein